MRVAEVSAFRLVSEPSIVLKGVMFIEMATSPKENQGLLMHIKWMWHFLNTFDLFVDEMCINYCFDCLRFGVCTKKG